MGDIELVRGAWAAFARGDLEAATAVLDPEVCWHGADAADSEGSCHNRDDALAFIRRAMADGMSAEPIEFLDAGDRVVVILQAHTPPEWGDQRQPHGELVTVRDRKVTEMVVYPTVDEALLAAGLLPGP